MAKIKVWAPATIASFGPGFELFAAALQTIGDIVAVEETRGKVKLKRVTGNIPQSNKSNKNTAVIAAEETLRELKRRRFKVKSVALSLEKGVPFGLGSSDASAAAAAFAVNMLYGNRLNKKELAKICLKAEKKVSREHLESIMASLYGGFILIRNYSKVDFEKIKAPANLFCVMVSPQLKGYSTKNIKVPSRETVFNKNRRYLKALVKGIKQKNIFKIGANVHDAVVEPLVARKTAVFNDVKKAAFLQGALGFGVSGLGPALFAITYKTDAAKRIGEAMKRAFKEKANIKAEVFVSRIDNEGVRVL